MAKAEKRKGWVTGWQNKKIAKGVKQGNETYKAIQKKRNMLDDIMRNS